MNLEEAKRFADISKTYHRNKTNCEYAMRFFLAETRMSIEAIAGAFGISPKSVSTFNYKNQIRPSHHAKTSVSEVVRIVKGEFEMGEYPKGTELPSRKAMADRFGVSVNVIVRAFEYFKREGYITSKQGAPTVSIYEG